MHSQRPYATYLPSNADYIKKANNLQSDEDFKRMIIGQRQIVTAVSFFCGNTLTVNLDPRTRLKTGKYNPPRTFTPKGAIGSGSVGQSIYSIDCPGGFMIWAMTLPDLCWNTFSSLKTLKPGKPWFFSNFDQIEYYEVDEAELTRLNNLLVSGKLELETKEVELNFGEYIAFHQKVEKESKKINNQRIKSTLQLANEDAESFTKWESEVKEAALSKKENEGLLSPEDSNVIPITGGMAANVFKIKVKAGEVIENDTGIVILEAMKMEIHISPSSLAESSDEDVEEVQVQDQDQLGSSKFLVLSIPVSEGDVVGPSDVLAFIKAI